jgi:HlyD family secretion protein
MKKNVGALLVLASGACHKSPGTPPGYQGVIEFDERTISFEVAGRVLAVPVHKGDVVKAGDVVAQLDDTLERLAKDTRTSEVQVATTDLQLLQAGTRKEDIASIAAQIAAAKASEALLEKNLERAQKLVATNSLPQAELDRAASDLDRERGERRSLEAKLTAMQRGARPEELARAQARVQSNATAVALEDERVARHVVKSLESGVVLDVHVKDGELAAAGTPVATLADVEHPYVDVFVPEGSLEGVRVGASAAVRTDAVKEPQPARVEWVSPKTEFTPRFLFSERERPNLVIRVRLRIEDPGHRLHAGVPAFATLER